MDLVKSLEAMMLIGSEWILYLLITLSVVSAAIAVERFAFLRKTRVDFQSFCVWVADRLAERKFSEIETHCAPLLAPEARLVSEALKREADGPESLEYRMNLLISGYKQEMEKGLIFLGTVGSNAPFIGLLGTVFGIIQAFHQLASSGSGGSTAVMTGISEALVTTGIGLFVAIPAVVLFNIFQRSVKTRVANLEATRDLLLSNMKIHKKQTSQQAA